MLTIAALFLTAAGFASGIMTFSNFERDGRPVLIPGVQKYEADNGTFALPKTLTVAVPEGEELVMFRNATPSHGWEEARMTPKKRGTS